MAKLNDSEIIALLKEVDSELGDFGNPVSLLCVGGAAISLKWGDRITKDIDIVSDNITPDIRAAVAKVGHRNGLPSDWLNDSAKGFIPTNLDPNLSQIFVGKNLVLYVPDAQYMLAMKLGSSRDNDKKDIILLMEESGLNQAEELFDLVEKSYPSKAIQPKTQYMIEEVVEQYNKIC